MRTFQKMLLFMLLLLPPGCVIDDLYRNNHPGLSLLNLMVHVEPFSLDAIESMDTVHSLIFYNIETNKVDTFYSVDEEYYWAGFDENVAYIADTLGNRNYRYRLLGKAGSYLLMGANKLKSVYVDHNNDYMYVRSTHIDHILLGAKHVNIEEEETIYDSLSLSQKTREIVINIWLYAGDDLRYLPERSHFYIENVNYLLSTNTGNIIESPITFPLDLKMEMRYNPDSGHMMPILVDTFRILSTNPYTEDGNLKNRVPNFSCLLCFDIGRLYLGMDTARFENFLKDAYVPGKDSMERYVWTVPVALTHRTGLDSINGVINGGWIEGGGGGIEM